jgi:exonuclease III
LPQKLIICNWNVNGLRSVISKNMLNPYINNLKPDIICITETKMDERSYDVAPIYLSGYHSYFNFSKHSAGYSGVAVFSKHPPKSMTEDMAER